MSDELVGRVMMEMIASVGMENLTPDDNHALNVMSRAAIAVVLEEAAKVAEECAPVSQDTWSTELAERCDMVAAAIRAMKNA